jgi:chromosome segregation ATPase
LGIDTTAAEAKYNEAKGKIDAAHALPSSQYTQVFDDLKAAQTAFDDGEKALDRAWAEKTVNDAGQQINRTSAMIGVFTGNQSLEGDSQLSSATIKRDLALANLSVAKNDLARENFSQARNEAQNAYKSANESYTDLEIRLQELASQSSCLGSLCYDSLRIAKLAVIALILIGVCAVGVLIWKRRGVT